MELRHVRAFIALSEELHFGRTATRLHLAQPALSQQIRQLEEELGSALFWRNSHQVALSQAGKTFLPRAREAVEALSAGALELQGVEAGNTGTVNIGFISTAALTLIPLLLRKVRKAYPEIEVNLQEADASQQTVALLREEIDVGLMHVRPADSALIGQAVENNEMVLAFSSRDPRAQDETVSLRAFAKEIFIIPEKLEHDDFRELALSMCKKAGFQPQRTQQVRMLQTALPLIGAGGGCAIMPANFRTIRPTGVVMKSLKGEPQQLSIHAVHRRSERSRLVRNVTDILTEIAS
ncbi:LysR family transcriptional regulator [Terriglobus roseus]|uniref:DNA-binding transcriptional regulator, LysR family n=1 Tax=Terriglobus roseus TaxID=392734 RepID=A0A1H4SD41_9BACT|nr:LysR family transcriptional regulator [Terriglobus roseus]SEC42086.1 DNA-binding transcriptional regulator, LysR family [Terriglobus roseus]